MPCSRPSGPSVPWLARLETSPARSSASCPRLITCFDAVWRWRLAGTRGTCVRVLIRQATALDVPQAADKDDAAKQAARQHIIEISRKK
jgi:hypothetical protein